MKFLLKTIVLLAVLSALGYFFMHKTPQQKAFERTLAAAQQGDASAQARVAADYAAGEGVRPDIQQSADWYKKAVAQGNAQAAYELAQLYLSGEKLPRDVPSGVSYLKMAAEKNYAPAQYALGRLYQTGAESLNQNLAQAAFLWMQAAEQKDADAQAALDLLHTEEPETYDQVQPLHAAWQRAQTGDATAAADIGQQLVSGSVLEKNPEQALPLLTQAAQGGHAGAAYVLYEVYNQPDGPIPHDAVKAMHYLAQSAQGGYAAAQYSVGQQLYQAAQTAEDFQAAFNWLAQAARQNHPEALYMCGILHMQGQGTEKSIPLAMADFKQAAELGHANAQYVLGQSYWRGIGLKKNKTLAKKWLELARQNGNPQAQELLDQIK